MPHLYLTAAFLHTCMLYFFLLHKVCDDCWTMFDTLSTTGEYQHFVQIICSVQIYPENATQAEMMVAAAMKVGTCDRHA
jgi:hypothetical protein